MPFSLLIILINMFTFLDYCNYGLAIKAKVNAD